MSIHDAWKEPTTETAIEAKPFLWRCPECGKKKWACHGDATSQIGDGRFTRSRFGCVPRCDACGELVFDNDADEQIAQRTPALAFFRASIFARAASAGLSQRNLAEHLGVAVETISRWETPNPNPRVDRYLRVYFGVPAARAALLEESGISRLGVHVET